MASPGNQHCANCIGTPSFPINCSTLQTVGLTKSPAGVVMRAEPDRAAGQKRASDRRAETYAGLSNDIK